MTHAKKRRNSDDRDKVSKCVFFWNNWLSPWLMLAGLPNFPILTQWRLHNPASSPIAQGSWYVLYIHIYPPKEDLRYKDIYILRNALYNNIIHTHIYMIYIYMYVCMCTNICINRYMYKHMYKYMIYVQHLYIIIYHISIQKSNKPLNQASAGPAAWATAHAFWPAKRSPRPWEPRGFWMKPWRFCWWSVRNYDNWMMFMGVHKMAQPLISSGKS